MTWQHFVTDLVKEAKTIPLFGQIPSFPLKNFEEALQKQLSTSDLALNYQKLDWLAPKTWREGLGQYPIVFSLEASPLKGKMFWVCSVEEMKKCCLHFLITSNASREKVENSAVSFLEGFYRFLFLKAFLALSEAKAFASLRFSFGDNDAPRDEPMLALDITLSFNSIQHFGKILIPQKTFGEFKHFFHSAAPSSLSTEQAAHIEVSLPLIVGQRTLSQTAWKQVNVGDFLILQHCDYETRNQSGKLRLFLEDRPIALCSFQDGTLKILAIESHEEEIVQLDDEYPEPEESQETPPPIISEEERLAELDAQEAEEESEELLSSSMMEEIPPLSKEISIPLCVEVARIKMTLDKVLMLKPGNVLDLLVSPAQGVTLTANGTPVARGELVQLGEVLGVKITELG